MTAIETLGLFAGTCTTAAFAPQALLVLKTRRVGDISLGMYSLFVFGVVLWIAYGLALGSLALVLSNAVTLLLAGTVLVLKLRLGGSKVGRAE